MTTEVKFVSTRLVKETVIRYGCPLDCPSSVVDFAAEYLKERDKELFLIVCVDCKDNVMSFSRISEGGMEHTIVDPRIVFKTALLAGASGIIAIHNHPSGDPTPSTCDLQTTDTLKKGSAILGIRFLDHIIIGDGAYYSFKEHGHLEEAA